jgi:hypothetical protein
MHPDLTVRNVTVPARISVVKHDFLSAIQKYRPRTLVSKASFTDATCKQKTSKTS